MLFFLFNGLTWPHNVGPFRDYSVFFLVFWLRQIQVCGVKNRFSKSGNDGSTLPRRYFWKGFKAPSSFVLFLFFGELGQKEKPNGDHRFWFMFFFAYIGFLVRLCVFIRKRCFLARR